MSFWDLNHRLEESVMRVQLLGEMSPAAKRRMIARLKTKMKGVEAKIAEVDRKQRELEKKKAARIKAQEKAKAKRATSSRKPAAKKPAAKKISEPTSKSQVNYNPDKGHYWRTVNGKKILFTKGGRMLNPPKWTGGSELDKDPGDSKGRSGMWDKPITKEQQKDLSKIDSELDKVLGKNSGFKADIDKDGDPVILNKEVEEAAEQDDSVDSTKLHVKVKKKGGSWSIMSALANLANAYGRILLKAGTKLSRVLGKSIRNLNSALQDWQR